MCPPVVSLIVCVLFGVLSTIALGLESMPDSTLWGLACYGGVFVAGPLGEALGMVC